MLSVQQFIKVVRKLQSSSNSGEEVRRLLKSWHHAYSLGLSDDNSTMTISDIELDLTKLKKIDNQQSQNSCCKENCSIITSNVNSDLLLDYKAGESDDSSRFSFSNRVDSRQLTFLNTAKILSQLHLHQQNQIFCRYHQNQHFHTEQPSNLFVKQQQAQSAMSSLAAEPLAIKQHEGSASNNGVLNSNGNDSQDRNGFDEKSKTTVSEDSSWSAKSCFNTGLGEILRFMELIGNLKHTKRTGWVLRDVNDCESISGHMYRMSMMTFLLDGSEGLNQIRCMELALVHDLAESLVGDITPFCGISKTDKRAMEFKAMEDICKLIEPRGKRIMELFEEYEKGESAESKFVKDLDRLDMVMQAFEYEKRDNCLMKHQEFFDSTEGKFNHPFIKKLVNEIYDQRKQLASTQVANEAKGDAIESGHCSTSASS